MLQLWGRDNSANVQKPLVCLEELGVPYVRHDAGLKFGVVDTPAYRALNPNGVIPTLVDGDFVVWESNTIVRYLAAKYGQGTLQPVDLYAQADSDRWMDWQQTTFMANISTLFAGLVRFPGRETPEALAQAASRGLDCVAMLNEGLATRSFMAGDRFGSIDCVLAPCVHRWLNLPHDEIQAARTTMPHLEAYYTRLMQRPALQKVLTLPMS